MRRCDASASAVLIDVSSVERGTLVVSRPDASGSTAAHARAREAPPQWPDAAARDRCGSA